jgi:hypothetical protein
MREAARSVNQAVEGRRGMLLADKGEGRLAARENRGWAENQLISDKDDASRVHVKNS